MGGGSISYCPFYFTVVKPIGTIVGERSSLYWYAHLGYGALLVSGFK